MKTLTIEHVKAYPFGDDGLKAMYGGYGDPDKKVTILGVLNDDNIPKIQFKFNKFGYFDTDIPEYFKLILHNLSDLTKEIEHNGEKFVPIDVLCSYGNREYTLYSILENIEQIQYWIIKKLLEWHFDVFGLIEDGLAIDINTLEL